MKRGLLRSTRRWFASSTASAATATLVTIPFSHYSELARWGLDASGYAYVERASMPGFHILTVMSATGSWKPAVRARAGSPWAVPMLVLPDGVVVRDSHEIAKLATRSSSLYPDRVCDAIDEDLHYFHDRVGTISRRFAYYHLFSNLDAAQFADIATVNGAPSWQIALLGNEMAFSRVRAYISRGLGVNKERAARGEEYITAELDAVAGRLEKSGCAYLYGDTPTLADLSFASLMAPALGISTTDRDGRSRMPPAEALGPEYAQKAASWREHPAGRFVEALLARRYDIDACEDVHATQRRAATTANCKGESVKEIE